MNARVIFQSIRGPFLVLTPACVFLGLSTVWAQGVVAGSTQVALVLIGALMAHISVNTFNEYFDLVSGLDLKTVRTPFSGGSGALPQHPEMAPAVLTLAIVTLLITSSIGLHFVLLRGWAIAPLGLLGLFVVVSYTNWINKHPFLCLFAPGLGFGLLMVGGSQFVLQGHYTAVAGLAALLPFFLVNNLLLLNQIPDISADAEAGRCHVPIVYGVQVAANWYAALALAAALVVATGIGLSIFPPLSALTLVPVGLSAVSWIGLRRYGETIGAHPQFLAVNVVVAVVSPLVLGLTLLLG